MSANDLSAKIAQLDAVIAVHMFGNMCDMPKLIETAQGKPIIEDCAQSIGSKLNGRPSGSFGSIAVFSFRSGKYLSVGEGGALFSSDKDLYSKLCRIKDEIAFPGVLDECKHVVKTFLRSTLRRRPFYGLIGYPLWQVYNKRVNYTEKTPIVLGRMFCADIAASLRRFPRLDAAIAEHRVNAEFYSKALKLDPGMLSGETPGAFYNRYLYPIMFPALEHRDRMAEYLHRKKIGSMRPYRDIAEVAAAHYGYEGDCPAAEEIAKRVLVIPSYHTLKRKELERIAMCVNDGWTEIKHQSRL
jgi:dTDP-4-amino-4,6-dideoxygalactose transaminase